MGRRKNSDGMHCVSPSKAPTLHGRTWWTVWRPIVKRWRKDGMTVRTHQGRLIVEAPDTPIPVRASA